MRSASTRAFAALLAAGIGLGNAASASAAEVRPFEPRFQQRVRGDISIVTSDSPMSTTTRPAGSTLLFAGLYWGGAARATTPVSMQVGSAPPTLVAAEDLDAVPLVGFGAVADVTELFAGTGPSVDLFVNGPAGVDWSLVTAWSSPTEPLRDLRVVDGLATATASDPAAVTVSGLSTPRRRAVDPTVEVVSHGGDARGEVEVQAGDTTATVPVEAVEADETLVAAVTTAGRAAAVTDLGVSADVAPATAGAAGTVTVTVDVSNAGPDDQTGPATLTVSTSEGLEPDPVSLATTAGTCGLIGGRAVCAVDPLPAGGRAVVTFDAGLGLEAAGQIGATARVLTPTSDTDPVPANDTAPTDLESPAP
jgi:hypothetical protein